MQNAVNVPNQPARKQRVDFLSFIAEESGPAIPLFGINGRLAGMSKADGSELKTTPVKQSVGYWKANGRYKTILSFPAESFEMIAPNRHFLKYGTVIAVDTNTRMVEGKRVSTTAIMSAHDLTPDAGGVFGKMLPVAVAEFSSERLVGFEEAAGWILALDILFRSDEMIKLPVALICDKGESHLLDYNSGKIPLFRDIYLPSGVKMIHATSDAGATEYIPNTMIAMADRIAREFSRKGRVPPADAVHSGKEEYGLQDSPLKVWGSETVSNVFDRMHAEGRSGLQALKCTVSR